MSLALLIDPSCARAARDAGYEYVSASFAPSSVTTGDPVFYVNLTSRIDRREMWVFRFRREERGFVAICASLYHGDQTKNLDEIVSAEIWCEDLSPDWIVEAIKKFCRSNEAQDFLQGDASNLINIGAGDYESRDLVDAVRYELEAVLRRYGVKIIPNRLALLKVPNP